MRLTCFIFLLGCTFSVAAQPAVKTGSLFAVAAMQADLDSMYTQLRDNHPDLYAYHSKAAADKAFLALRRSIRQPMDTREYTALLAKFVASFKDGHSFISVEFDSDAFNSYAEQNLFFPAGVRIVNNKLIVADNRYCNELIKGAEILSINGKKTTELLKEMTAIFSADGKAGALATTQRLFSYGLWWRYGWGNKNEMVIRQAGRKKIFNLPGINKTDLLNSMFDNGISRKLQLYPNLAVVEINSYNQLAKAKMFIDSCFRVIKTKQITNIALDLRRNGGGNSAIGDYFLAHLTDLPFNSVSQKIWRTGPLVNALPAEHWMAKSIEAFRKTARQDGAYLYSAFISPSLPEALNDSTLKVSARFFLLTSARTFSSAHMTAMAVKCGKLGTIIGQPTGERLNLTGEILEYVLPQTKISIVIPTAIYKTPCGNGNQVGVMPDKFITTTIDDLRQGRDPEIEYLLKLVSEG